MMSLERIADNTRTDKNTTHSYLPLYEFKNKNETAQNILEIGIHYGGSIKLWSDNFISANIYGLDIIHVHRIAHDIKNKENIILYTSTDA